jgi:hypothetical protein
LSCQRLVAIRRRRRRGKAEHVPSSNKAALRTMPGRQQQRRRPIFA